MIRFVFSISLLSICFISCEKDNLVGPQCIVCPADSLNVDSIEKIETKVFITNEGNFTWNNASLSLYNPKTKFLQNGAYKGVNNTLLGDVVQSMTIIDNKGFIVVNNSNKIEVIDANTLEKITAVNGFNTPRYMLRVDDQKAYVTSLFGDEIHIFNYLSYQITGTIPLNGWTEELVLIGTDVFVINVDKNKLYKIDATQDLLTDSLELGVSPNSIIVNGEDIWVLCDGRAGEAIPQLYQINSMDFVITKVLDFDDVNRSPRSLAMYNNDLYFLDGGVVKIDVNASEIPEAIYIDEGEKTYYGLEIDPDNGDIYVSDAVDYVQNGFVYRYNSSGQLVDQMEVGIIPGSFYFHEQ